MSIQRIQIDAFAGQLDAGATVLVPNNRIRDAVLHAYADQCGSSVFKTPKVLGIDVWVRETWERAANLGIAPYSEQLPIDATEELFVWIGLIENSLQQLPLLNPEETASAVSRAYQLMQQWQLQDQHEDTLRAYQSIPDIAAFSAWCDEFQRRCSESCIISLVDCIQQICTDLVAGKQLPLAGEILLLNFYQPPPLYAQLFKQLGRHSTVTDLQLASDTEKQSGQHFQFPTPRAEFHHVANWAKGIMAEDQQAHIGLVGELGENQRTELERIVANTLNADQLIDFCSSQVIFNSSHSTHSLMDEGLVHDAFLLFKLVREEQIAEDFCRLLRSPFVLEASQEQRQRQLLEQEIRQRLTSRCRTHDLAYYLNRDGKDYHCPQFAAALLQAGERARRIKAVSSPKQWAELFRKLLHDFQWPGSNLTPHQHQVIIRFNTALDHLAALGAVLGPIDHSKAISRLRSICQRSKHSQSFEHRRQISLYSIEEASGLNFDHLWILNFNDQAWPPPISPSPFLPYSLQKDSGIPGSHSDVQYEMAREAFHVLWQSVTGTVQSSHHLSDGEQEFRASGFARNFSSADPAGPLIEVDPSPHCFYGNRFSTEPKVITVVDDAELALAVDGKSLGGHSVLSDQSSCPFRAFALYRLQAEPLPEFETGLSRMARGTAIHEALEYLFTRIEDQAQLQGMSADQLLDHCEAAAAIAIAYLNRHHQALMRPRFEAIENKRIVGLLLRFLEKEKQRADFQVQAREQRQTWTYRDMLFSLKIDRIDVLEDGSLAIIDYKTGKTTASTNSWLGDRPEDLQLPFYSTVMHTEQLAAVNAIAIAHVNAEKIDYSGIMDNEQFHKSLIAVSEKQPGGMDWPTLSQHFQTVLHAIADEFHAGIARVDPANPPVTCRYCDLHSLCRIQELTADAAVNDTEGS